MSTIHQKFTGDVSQLEKEIEKLRAQDIKREQQLKRLMEVQRSSAEKEAEHQKSLSGLLQSNIGKLGQMATAYGLAAGGVRLIIDHEKELIRVMKERGELVRDSADSQQEFIRNLGPIPKEQVAKYIEAGKLSALNLGLSQQDYFRAVSKTTAATAGNADLAMEAVNAAAPLAPADRIGDISAALPIMKNSGGFSDMKQAAAFMLSMSSQMRFDDISKAKALANAVQSGQVYQTGRTTLDEAQATGALFSAFGQQLADDSGEVTKTAVKKFERVLSEVVGGDLDSMARLAVLQKNSTLSEKFLKAYGNDESTGAAKMLLDPASDAAKQLNSAKASFTTSTAAYDQMVTNLNYGSPETIAKKAGDLLKADADEDRTKAIAKMRTDISQYVQDKLVNSRSPDSGSLNFQQWMIDVARRSEWQMLTVAKNIPQEIAFGRQMLDDRLETRRKEVRGWKPGTYDPSIETTLLRAIGKLETIEQMAKDNRLDQNWLKEFLSDIADNTKATATSTAKAAQIPAGANRNVGEERD